MPRWSGYILSFTCIVLSVVCRAGWNVQDDPQVILDSLYQVAASDTNYVRDLRTRLSTPRSASMTAAALEERAVALIVLGHSEVSQGAFDTADSLFDGAIRETNGIHADRLVACAYFERGRCNVIRNDLSAAIVLFDQALKIATKTGYQRLEARIHYGIGHAFLQAGDGSSAIEHLQRAATLATDKKDRYRFSIDLADMESEAGHLASAAQHLAEVSAIAAEHPEFPTARMHAAYGTYYNAQGSYDEAIASYQRVVDDEVGKATDRPFPAWCMAQIANAHRLAGRYQQAVAEAQKGLAWCRTWSLTKEAQDNLRALYLAEAAMGNKVAAFDHLQRHLAIKDSLNAPSVTGVLNNTVLRGEFARKEQADSLLRAEQNMRREAEHRTEVATQRYTRNLTLVSGAGVLLLATGLWYRLRFMRKAKSAIEAEHARSESLLLNILPAEVAEELKARGEAEARHIDHVTVLFTDFKGFTAMSEQLTPKELVRDIHECFSAFDRICEKYGIEKIKTIGDAYMAAGGLPTPNTTHALDVVQAALEIRDFIAEGKTLKIAKGLPYFEIRIGVHTGPVVAGIVGVKKFAYDIWGDTVNIASRMESSGEVGQVNISEATYALVKDAKKVDGEWSIANGGSTHSPTPIHHSPHSDQPAFTFTPRGKVQAKGKGEMEMYFVTK